MANKGLLNEKLNDHTARKIIFMPANFGLGSVNTRQLKVNHTSQRK